jgi:hypothetical protein
VHFRLLLVAALAASFLTAAAAAEGAYRFGSELNQAVQPQPGQVCDPDHPSRVCTWIMNEAVGRPNGGHKARQRGKITKIRVIAHDAGKFRLQIARARETASGYEGKVVRNGPMIEFDGQPDQDEPYLVEVFRVNVPVRKGDRLAIRARKAQILRCGGGGDSTLLFHPPLAPGDGFRANFDTHNCLLLIEAVVRPAAR